MTRGMLFSTAALLGACALAMQARAGVVFQETFSGVDFTSQYANVTGQGSSASVPEGTFALERNPFSSQPYWVSTTYPGDFMAVNGAPESPPLVVWEKDGLSTTPGQTYTISFEVADDCCNSNFAQSGNAPFNLAFNLNTGSGFKTLTTYVSKSPDPSPGTIYTVTGSFTGGGVLDLQLIDNALNRNGNDFAIGDIVLTAAGDPPGGSSGGAGGDPPPSSVPEPATWAVMILGLAMVGYALRRRNGAPFIG